MITLAKKNNTQFTPLLALAALAYPSLADPPLQPAQVHLALTGARGEMDFEFFTAGAGARVLWGTAPGALTASAAAAATPVELNTWRAVSNVALMAPLSPNTTYWYVVGDAVNGFSALASFVNEPAREGGAVWAIYADLGLANNEALGAITADALAGGFDYAVHSGDFAYDLDSDFSRVGNEFFASIEPVASRVPYLAAAGNHEAVGTQGGSGFLNFAARFSALSRFAGARSGSNTSLWYSLEEGLVHLVVLNSETWVLTAAQQAAQLAWLRRDLARVDRGRTPWVIVAAHKIWDMDNVDLAGIADALMTAGAAPPDLYFAGHRHAYYRYFAVDQRAPPRMDYACNNSDASVYARCAAPVLVVSGAAGDVELNSPTCGAAPTIYLRTCSVNYGFGKLTVVNATHARWRWSTAVPRMGTPDPTYADQFIIVRGGA